MSETALETDARLLDARLLDISAWYTPLPGFEFTLCSGHDSARFLQGQLSCNVDKLTPTQSLRGTLCNLKGRVITNLQLLADPDGIVMLTQHGMREKMLATLNKYRVFFKAEFSPCDARLTAIGLGGSKVQALAEALSIVLPAQADQCHTQPGLRVVRLPQSGLNAHPRFLLVAESDTAAALLEQLQQTGATQLPPALWRLADIRGGLVNLRPAQSEQYTPQLLNYDINGAVDFKKGCYTGQEIVARMHYRAEAKRRLYHSIVQPETVAPAVADEDLLDAMVLADGSTEALLVMSISEAENYSSLSAFS